MKGKMKNLDISILNGEESCYLNDNLITWLITWKKLEGNS